MSESKKPIRIWICEDHANFAKQISRLIAGEDDLVCEKAFNHPDDLMAEFGYCAAPPDLLMLDLGLPGKDGLQVLREVKAKFPDQRIVILTPSKTANGSTAPSATGPPVTCSRLPIPMTSSPASATS